MLLQLEDGHKIICEHKIEAKETLGTSNDKREQLLRYLDLPIDGLAYFRADNKKIRDDVINNSNYIKPINAVHFLWGDLFKSLETNKEQFIVWLKEAFENFGYTPPLQSIGDLNSPNDEIRNFNRNNFAKIWTRTISLCHKNGWEVERASIVELYISTLNNKYVSSIFISPIQTQRFLIRFTPKIDVEISQLFDKLYIGSKKSNVKSELIVNKVTRKDGKIEVIDIKSSFYNIIGSESKSYMEVEKKLSNYIAEFIGVIN